MELLYYSDVVDLPKGKHLRINLLPGTGYEITGAARFTIRDKPVFTRGKAAKRFDVDKRECAAAVDIIGETGDGDENSLLKGKGERSGVYRMRGVTKGKIILLRTLILPSKALFSWNRSAHTVIYEIQIRDGEEVLWAGSSPDNYFMYPFNAPSLAGRENLSAYIRGVDAGKKETGSGINEFSLYDNKSDAAFMRRESEIGSFVDVRVKYLLLARLYETYGIIPRAIEMYKEAVRAGEKEESLKDKIKPLTDEMEVE
jgi:hypothetical protein